ncbi:MAG: polyhydroxyalkanoate synthesis repressor PhaR [Gammaproteobacteria bacterium]
MSESIDKRVIKKYPNRRLYDTDESKYVTLSDVRELVLGGVAFCVIDKKSGDDITRSILLQIIIEQEEEENVDPMFSTEVLEQMIGFYGRSVQGQAGDFIQNSLSLFQEQQKRFQEQVTGALQNNPMSSGFAEVAQRNMDMWQQMQNTFFSAAGVRRPGQGSTDNDE